MTDFIGGQVDVFTADFAVMLPQVRAGKIRGLAVTSAQRSKATPELPTVDEALGIKGYELIAYFAMFAPAGTPAEIIQKLNNALNTAAIDKAILERFSALGFETGPASPDALAQRTKSETAKWARAIREAKIEPQ
jgi:tripartite-type tricarboxylate transporter receptor subunit TctC